MNTNKSNENTSIAFGIRERLYVGFSVLTILVMTAKSLKEHVDIYQL